MKAPETTPYEQLATPDNWENAHSLPSRGIISRIVDTLDFMLCNKALRQLDETIAVASDLSPWRLRGKGLASGTELPLTKPGDFLSVVLDEVITSPQGTAPQDSQEQSIEEFNDAALKVLDFPWYLATTPAERQEVTRSGSVTTFRRSALLLGSTATSTAFTTAQLVRAAGEDARTMDVYVDHGSFILPRMVVGRSYVEDGPARTMHARVVRAEQFTVPMPVEVG